MLGLQRGTVQVISYSPQWATFFQDERKRLTDALGALALDIQHIGSTSVLGLAAKPILDIGVAIASEADVRSVCRCCKRSAIAMRAIAERARAISSIVGQRNG